MTKTAEEILHPLQLKTLLEKSVTKLAGDECYPDVIRNELKCFTITSHEASNFYQMVKNTVKDFHGDAEKFYPTFYKCISENESGFISLSRHCSLLLGFEVANHILAHLGGSSYTGEIVNSKIDQNQFSKRDLASIGYLSGYVFGTVYRRIRSSKQWQNAISEQCMSILLAGKISSSDDTLQQAENEQAEPNQSSDSDKYEHLLVSIRNRGGLWKVSPEVVKIFSLAEVYFRSKTSSSVVKIDAKDIVAKLMTDFGVLSNFSNLRSKAKEKVNKEIALNLLEQLLSLYIRVRGFSYAKDKLQQHKVAAHKTKSRSLRTEIKKASATYSEKP